MNCISSFAEVGWNTAEERYTGRFNGERAVFVTASAKDRVDGFAGRDGIYERIERFESSLPDNVRVERGFDQSRNVKHRLGRLGLDFAIAIGYSVASSAPSAGH